MSVDKIKQMLADKYPGCVVTQLSFTVRDPEYGFRTVYDVPPDAEQEICDAMKNAEPMDITKAFE